MVTTDIQDSATLDGAQSGVTMSVFLRTGDISAILDRFTGTNSAARSDRSGRASVTRSETKIIGLQQLAFDRLVRQWHDERGATSSITEMAICPSYQRIIGMGADAIPLILRQLESEGDEPDMWFWALQVVTMADPVTDEARGDFVAMASAWLAWGRQRYAW